MASKSPLCRKSSIFDFGNVTHVAMLQSFHKKLHAQEEVHIDDSNGFSIMLKITTAKFLARLQAMNIAGWHDAAAERAAGLDRLPRFNHEVLPLLCWNPLEGTDTRLQIKLPTIIVIRGSTCTSIFENNELENIMAKVGQNGVPAEGLVWELRRITPWHQWNLTHGSIIAKRLHVDGDGEALQYATPACHKVMCFRDCAPASVRHKTDTLGNFNTIAIPHTTDDLAELLKALNHVKPDTVPA